MNIRCGTSLTSFPDGLPLEQCKMLASAGHCSRKFESLWGLQPCLRRGSWPPDTFSMLLYLSLYPSAGCLACYPPQSPASACSASPSPARAEQAFLCLQYTVEFGVVREDGEIKAFGAGVLSSFAELAHMRSGRVDFQPFNPFVPQPKMR